MTLSLHRTALMLLAASALGATPAMARTHHHHAAKKGHHSAGHAAASSSGGGELVTVSGEPATYVVKKGDTLAKIADQLDTTVAELKRDNKLKGNDITPGQELKGPATASRKAYVVKHGDTVFSIAKRFHVTVADLRSANGLSSRSQIHSGQKLTMPAGFKAPAGVAEASDEAPAKARRGRLSADEVADEGATRGAAGRVETVAGGARTYRVRKGDTLEKVADKLGTSVAELKRDNHLKRNAIRPGQTLKGPRTGTSRVYVAASGDTLAGVAERFGVSVKALKSANGMGRRAGVRAGQRLHLPAGARDTGRSEVLDRATVGAPRGPLRGEVAPALPSRPQPYQPSGASPRTAIPVVPSAPATPTPGPTDAQISQLGRGKFAWPLTGDIITEFGATSTGQRNDGLNIRAAAGSPVRAAADGEVVYAGDQAIGFGNVVLVKHADGWVTVYAYLSRIDVKNQQKVTQGQQIGQAGQTGGVSEPQLHFEVRYAPNPAERAKPVDPKLVLPK